MDRDFSNDVAFLEKHVDVILLSSDESLAMVAVVPQYQGRVIEVYQRVGAWCREGVDESYIRKRHRA